MTDKRKKIVIAAGGTGGHLFPAQALADQIRKEHPNVDIVFMGAGLKSNRYFEKERYPHFDVVSATPFRRSVAAIFKSVVQLAKGIKESLKLLRQEEPDLIVGFGSFHSFPILCAARLQKRPMALFESNAYPGKVIRIFSSSASFTAIAFSQAETYLKGKAVEVAMPVRVAPHRISIEEARGYFGLDPRYPTLLIFGGSQGASALNQLLVQSMEALKTHYPDFQVIHIAGNAKAAELLKEAYARLKMKVCVKEFEPKMAFAYQASTLAICRSGAATVSELIAFELPSILIPFPYASDDHQTKNAQFLQQEVKGAITFQESSLTKEILANEIYRFLDPDYSKIAEMKKALSEYKTGQNKKELCTLIYETISPK